MHHFTQVPPPCHGARSFEGRRRHLLGSKVRAPKGGCRGFEGRRLLTKITSLLTKMSSLLTSNVQPYDNLDNLKKVAKSVVSVFCQPDNLFLEISDMDIFLSARSTTVCSCAKVDHREPSPRLL